MKKLIVLFLSCTLMLLSANVSFAQDRSDKTTTEPVAKQPLPKKTTVQYAPNAKQPTLQEQIIVTEKMLKQLKATPEEKRPQFIKDKIARLEKELVAKREELKKTNSN